MKSRMKCALALATATMGMVAFGAVSVSNVVVQQRWPWNGKVDIDYEVFSDSADDSVFVYPSVLENDRNIAIAPRTLSGDGVETAMVGARVKPGKHRMTWHMDTDEPSLHSSSSTITLHAVKGGMYLIVDLSGGPNAESYPIRYSDTPPDLTKGDCRTTELWLRLCLPGTFTMGSPSDEGGRELLKFAQSSTEIKSGYETLHQVSLTKPFYVGVFEMTQGQYNMIMGNNPSYEKGDERPVETVSYEMIRGSVAGAAYPVHTQVDPSSFMGKLRARTGCLFDLPTEAQWEYACRAGTSTAFNNGKSIGSDLCAGGDAGTIGRMGFNCSDNKGECNGRHTKVGCYEPNQWGLYDMHGNVYEWCLDWFQMNLGNGRIQDPLGPSRSDVTTTSDKKYWYRVIRGGSWMYIYGRDAAICRSAARAYYVKNYWRLSGDSESARSFSSYPSSVKENVGFRVACIPVVQ